MYTVTGKPGHETGLPVEPPSGAKTLTGTHGRIYEMAQRAVSSEATTCANYDREQPYAEEIEAGIPRIVVLLHIVARWTSSVLIVFGTAVFSALQFVTLADVLARLIASTVICRLILILELAGLRRASS
ncbi:hypothetical protein F4677DRAFT_440141 [Hypoxylon crocopeplum]|nr:hypothetical protein F4677DRAFT_440141 [Hypoxylon crocopeplum]